jgi:hypothetical protein
MAETTTETERPKKAPECWCSYGTEGLGEFTRFPHPQCPEHEPQNAAPNPTEDDYEFDCDTCRDEWEDCCDCEGGGEDDYASDGLCSSCGGSGGRVPSHCCKCGGSPYCNCCPKCGGGYVGACKCPIEVQLSDGTTKVV